MRKRRRKGDGGAFLCINQKHKNKDRQVCSVSGGEGGILELES